jgi:hypothetical protein
LVRFLLLSAECTACQIDNDIYVWSKTVEIIDETYG